MNLDDFWRKNGLDLALLWMRATTSLLLFLTNGWPKIAHYGDELTRIDDPLGLGRPVTLGLALFAEVLCPAAVVVGIATRWACVPIIVLLAVAMTFVHRDWTLGQGQFAWLYVIVYATLVATGAGGWSLDARRGLRTGSAR